MSNIRKRAFQISTTAHPNAVPYQDGESHQWVVEQLRQIAEAYAGPGNPNGRGPTVTVIVEIIE